MLKRRTGTEERGKREDAAALLPILGGILLTPFLANLFLTRSQLFGLPLDMLYLFAVWALLILGAVLLSSRLPHIGSSDAGKTQKDNGAPSSGTD